MSPGTEAPDVYESKETERRRKAAVRTALVLAVVAAGIFVVFFAMQIW